VINDLSINTAIDISFPLVDASGAPVTGKVSGDFTKRIKKEGGAWGAMTVTITEEEHGRYTLAVTGSHSDTAGVLNVTLVCSGALNVYFQWRVVTYVADTLASKLLKYFQLVVRKDAAIATDNAAELTALNASGGSGAGAFANTTDSQEAIRDFVPTAADNADAVHDEDSGHLRAHLKTALKLIVGIGSTTTAIVLDATTGVDGGAPSAVNDFYNGQTVKFTSGALAGQRVDVSDYDGASKTMTVSAMTSAPVAAVTAISA
jgi:hypothetical protein